MQSQILHTTIQQYKAQRDYRQSKRKQYLRRFEIIKQKFHINNNEKPVGDDIVKPAHNPNQNQKQNKQKQSEKHGHLSKQEQQVLRENEKLRNQLQALQNEQKQKLGKFKNQIAVVKGKYLDEIKQLTILAKQNKQMNEAKAKKIESQIQQSIKKNEQIEAINKQIEQQLQQNNGMIQSYSQQIKKQYSDKLEQFEKIFKSSNEKIQAMEKQFNEDQFIETTLKNQQLLKTIEETCQKSQDTQNILTDYKKLLQGKQQIIKQLDKNNDMKQQQIQKMLVLEQKLKVVFDKLNEQKKIIMLQNSKMTQQLMQVKALLTAGVENG